MLLSLLYNEFMRRIDKEYKWFDKNRRRIVTNHEGEFVLVSGRKMWGYYMTATDGIKDAVQRGFQWGKFLVHRCSFEEPVIQMGSIYV